MSRDFIFYICKKDSDFEIAKSITKDYMEWLGMDLCFQNIDKEFEGFSQMYGEPKGCFIYAKYKGEIVGGLGCRNLNGNSCEMKRLYVYEKFQGKGFGRLLCIELIKVAKALGYKTMKLDTVERLKSANSLYESMGFVDVPKYYDNPEETVRYMELVF